MQKQLAIQGDELKSLNLSSDTSLFIASVMYVQGYKIFWYQPKALRYENNKFIAKGNYIKVWYEEENEELLRYELDSEEIEIDLETFAAVMIRQNPPVDINYIASTHLLSLLKNRNPDLFFINDPEALRNEVEKLVPITIAQKLQRPEIIPQTVITSDYAVVEKFLSQHKHIVLKPLYGYGGQDVIQVREGETGKILKYLMHQKDIQVIVQQFLPEIYDGDKRVIVCDGEVVGVVGRIPAKENFLTNTAAGGSLCDAELTVDERDLCEKIASELKNLGIFFAGIDLIGNFVTEINITSPSLLLAIAKTRGMNATKTFFEKLKGKLSSL